MVHRHTPRWSWCTATFVVRSRRGWTRRQGGSLGVRPFAWRTGCNSAGRKPSSQRAALLPPAGLAADSRQDQPQDDMAGQEPHAHRYGAQPRFGDEFHGLVVAIVAHRIDEAAPAPVAANERPRHGGEPLR